MKGFYATLLLCHVYMRLFLILVLPATAAFAADDIIVADFEGRTYGEGWKIEGNAFGDGPTMGAHNGARGLFGYRGNGLANSFCLNTDNYNNYKSVGTLTSPEFRIERPYIQFLIGGGKHRETALELLVGDKAVKFCSGENDPLMRLSYFDVSDHMGKKARVRIIDHYKAQWGFIYVDHIVQTGEPPHRPKFQRFERKFKVTKKYLVMPIQRGKGRQNSISLFVNDKEVRRYDRFRLAQSRDEIAWYAYFTIDSYTGAEARVVADAVSEDISELIRQSDTVPSEVPFYHERHRPRFHFTPKVGWVNDPNGLVYHNGTWHFFFQHSPLSLLGGNMAWGHAISRDLVHWEQQSDKLFPNVMAKKNCFSGSAAVDRMNTSGWGKDTLVVFFTDTGCGESIAYSRDNGKTFTYYENNPVVKHPGRDPKVIWYEYGPKDRPLNDRAKELGGHWVMIVFDWKKPWIHNAAFYTSVNMRDWTEQSHLKGYFECTELFKLPVDHDETVTRWVVFGADAKYAVGRFDGKTFTPDHEGKHQLHYGNYYASQTFSNAPNGRKIQIGWARWLMSPGPYNQHFTFPHRLTLRTTPDGIRMFANPIEVIRSLRKDSSRLAARTLRSGEAAVLPVDGSCFDIQVSVELDNAKTIILTLPNRDIVYDVVKNRLHDSTGNQLYQADLKPVDGRITIRVLFDRSIMEVIGNDGRVYMTMDQRYFHDVEKISVRAEGGNAKLLRFEAYELKSIWKQAVTSSSVIQFSGGCSTALMGSLRGENISTTFVPFSGHSSVLISKP